MSLLPALLPLFISRARNAEMAEKEVGAAKAQSKHLVFAAQKAATASIEVGIGLL
jgi:hypothetical protein